MIPVQFVSVRTKPLRASGRPREPIPGPAARMPAAIPTASRRSPIAPRATALLEVILCSGFPTQLMLVVILTRLRDEHQDGVRRR